MKKKLIKKENIYNVPNFLTLLRFILSFVLIYLFFNVETKNDVFVILGVFIFAAFTDFLDGQIARRFDQVTRFGAKFDIISDRLLWIITGILLVISFPLHGIFDNYHLIQMMLILTREILCLPIVLINLVRKDKIMMKAQWSGKTTTFLQGFAIPSLILSVYYPVFEFSIILAIACFFSGIWSFRDYSRQMRFFGKRN
jgi:CDP-diacylglycerol--glycerol-3-phosphate 3-phosphatidyltransferase